MTYGQYSPLVVSGNEILCGTLVYDAMKRLKMRRAKIVQVGELSEEKKRELRYLDNRTFEMSFWKDDELKMFLMSLEKNELEDCGFKEDEVEQMINGFIDEGKKAKKNVLQELNKQQADIKKQFELMQEEINRLKKMMQKNVSDAEIVL
jgi:hypothetical protein